jgi:hypothetical protein
MHPLAFIGLFAIALVQLLHPAERPPLPPPAAAVLAEPVADSAAARGLGDAGCAVGLATILERR